MICLLRFTRTVWGNILSTEVSSSSAYVRLWGPLWTHSAHTNSMIHSKHGIADQLVFSVDVSNTLSTIVDKLVFQESEHLTFSIQIQQEGKTCRVDSRNIYGRNSTVVQPLTRGAKGNPITFLIVCEHNSSTDFPLIVPSRIKCCIQSIMADEKMAKGTAPYAVFLTEPQNAVVIQKFCLCRSTSALALVQPFQVSPTSRLKSTGNPCRDVLQDYADIDLSAFVTPNNYYQFVLYQSLCPSVL